MENLILEQQRRVVQVGSKLNHLPPAVLSDGNTVAWFDYKQNVTKDGSGIVSVWGDKSGNNRDLSGIAAYEDDGILFNGTSHYLKSAAFAYAQPEFIYMVFKQITWASSRRIFDGHLNSSGALVQRTSSPRLEIVILGSAAANEDLAINTWGVLRVLISGNASKIQVNNNAATTGNPGVGNMGGITIASSVNTTDGFSNIKIKEAIFRKVVDTEENESLIYNWLASKYGFIVTLMATTTLFTETILL